MSTTDAPKMHNGYVRYDMNDKDQPILWVEPHEVGACVEHPCGGRPTRQIIKDAAEAVLSTHIDPGMGGPPEPVWETYRPEGVALLLAEAIDKALTEAGRYADAK